MRCRECCTIKSQKCLSALQDSVIMCTTGSRTRDNQADNHLEPSITLRKQMFEILDQMTGEIKHRFKTHMPELVACGTCSPSAGKHFLNYDVMEPLAQKYKHLGIDLIKLKGQSLVAKNMIVRQTAWITRCRRCFAISYDYALCFSGFDHIW